jgi:hypothetical protein
MAKVLYIVVEHFKNKDAVPVYQRFREHGRMAPQGLVYVSSWVDQELECCYQLMETEDRMLLDQWIANWSDIVDFEIHPVLTSKEAAEKIAPFLSHCPDSK